MITRILEELIGKGIAKAGTFSVGASGVSTLNVPNNEVCIIHHYDYWHFVDMVASTQCNPASSSFSIDGGIAQFNFTWHIPISICGDDTIIVFDPLNPTGTFMSFQLMLDECYPGFLLTSATFGLGIWNLTVTAPCPSAYLNGVTPTFTIDPIALPVSMDDFEDGIDSQATIQDVINASEHIIEFRSKNSRNCYSIRENITLFFWEVVTGNPLQYGLNVNGYYSKDCYLVHEENVQIDIWKVPPVSQWGVTYTTLPNKSNENKQPVGYGIGAGNANAVREVLFDGVAGSEQYLPLTNQRDDLVSGGVPSLHNQFRPDITNARALNNPALVPVILSNGRVYPLVNIDYILISAKNYSKYLGNSV